MKIPEKIKGRNKIRDAKIILLWDREEKETSELSAIFNLSQRRIEQILRDNHAFVPVDKEWEKKKRIRWLKLQIKRLPITKKDPADLMEQLRIEVEGNKVEHSGKIGGGVTINNYPQRTFVFSDLDDNDTDSKAITERLHASSSAESVIPKEPV